MVKVAVIYKPEELKHKRQVINKVTLRDQRLG